MQEAVALIREADFLWNLFLCNRGCFLALVACSVCPSASSYMDPQVWDLYVLGRHVTNDFSVVHCHLDLILYRRANKGKA